MSHALDLLLRQLEEGYSKSIEDLKQLASIPSCGWETYDQLNLEHSADWVRQALEELDLFESVEVVKAANPKAKPAVLANRPAKSGAPTVLLYAHHDVQPAQDASLWDTPPFTPTRRGDRLYGRGVADDKAGVMVHISALRALSQAAGADFDPGIRVFIEGEEEISSPSFEDLLAERSEFFDADVLVVTDSDNPSTETAGITASLRGNIVMNLRVKTLTHASHSGFFGGAVPDAVMVMLRLLNALYDEKGSVAVPGLVSYSSDSRIIDERYVREHAGLLEGVSLIGVGSVTTRLWCSPAITVIGLDTPSVANASNTIQPECVARLSIRLAPGQQAQAAIRAVTDYLTDQVPFGARLEITDVESGNPYKADLSGWAFELFEASLEQSFARPVERIGVGGSIPMISTLSARYPKMQMLVTGIEDPDTKAHSPNESLSLSVFKKAVEAEARFLLALIENRPYLEVSTAPEAENAASSNHGVALTSLAVNKVRQLLSQEDRDDLRLRIAVQPGGCSGLIYQLYFDERLLEGDAVREFDGVYLVVDPLSQPYLDGASIDFHDTIEKQGFTIDNPNAAGTCACGDSFS